MKQIQNFCERYGKWMYGFALIFTFAYSFFYSAQGSNSDYYLYMHFVDDGEYNKHAMIAGTILLSKPLWFMFGYKLWMWKVWAWCMASFTAVIPFYTLLNKEQRKKYAYIMALVILVLNIRYGLEPPKYVYLFSMVMLTFFVKYLQNNKQGWVIAVSVCAAFITFVRFPSFFAWPVVIIAMLLLKKNVTHILYVVGLPIILFCVFVTLTNGGICCYFEDMGDSIGASANGDHSIMNLFRGYVTSSIHAIAYMILICLPLLMYIMWKRNEQVFFKIGFIVSFFMIATIIVVHPTEHLSCALTMATVVLGGYCYRWNFKYIVLGSTIVITNMFCSIGSDCGFAHDYYCVCFIPFLLETMKMEKKADEKTAESVQRSFSMPQVVSLFTSLVLLLSFSTFVDRCMLLENKFSSGIVNGGDLSPNLSGLYFDKLSLQRCYVMQKEYSNLKKSHSNVIYWGTFHNHFMSFINSQWPVTDIWKIESKDKDKKPFCDFVEYVKRNKPVVIDLEKHSNTKTFMMSQGYVVKNRDFGNIYTIKK